MSLEEARARARRAWPDFTFGDDFVRFLEVRGWPRRELALEDLALVFACVSTQRGALEQLLQLARPSLDAAFANTGAARADLEQALWLKLFTGAPIGLDQYSGVGSLRGWVRVAGARLALNHATRGHPADETESALLERLAPDADPELAVLKRELAGDVQEALTTAFLALSSRERALLRQVIGQGATVEQVARALGTPRSTAGRHVKEARDRFAQALRAEVAARFGAASVSARRVLALVESQLDQRWLEVTRVEEP